LRHEKGRRIHGCRETATPRLDARKGHEITTITIVRATRAFVSLLALTATLLFAAGVGPID
jgi:hypothetical protein